MAWPASSQSSFTLLGLALSMVKGDTNTFQILFSISQDLRKTPTKNKIKNRKYPFPKKED